MQIDFGERKVWIAGELVTVHFLVAVLGFSRRLFVKAFLHERQGEWLDGIAAAFQHFGGVPSELLGDNARCLVLGRDRAAQTVTFHPAYLAFCRDWDVQPRACQPYRARTKGKTESGVKYVKRNAIAGRRFDSFAQLEAHLAEWQLLADQRVHGTTHELPLERFERDERQALRSLPVRPLPTHGRRLQRRVANDSFVDIDTVRYSVPHRLVRDHVEVLVTAARFASTTAPTWSPPTLARPSRTRRWSILRTSSGSGARPRRTSSRLRSRSPAWGAASRTTRRSWEVPREHRDRPCPVLEHLTGFD